MAMNPYSIAVAPEVLRHIEEKIFASPAMIICSVGGWIYETAIEQTKRLTACS
jgi:hypothetical protein